MICLENTSIYSREISQILVGQVDLCTESQSIETGSKTGVETGNFPTEDEKRASRRASRRIRKKSKKNYFMPNIITVVLFKIVFQK